MYADRVLTGSKRSVKDRLDTDFAPTIAIAIAAANNKRQRQNDDKWKHDLYDNDQQPQLSNPRGGERDLRQKLQKKGRGHMYVKSSTARASHDLRNKLSASMRAQPVNNQPKEVVEVPKPLRKNVSVEVPAPETKKASNPVSRKKSQQKAEGSSSVDSLLQSLGLEKYSITFQKEEIDMTALIHMTDDDLKDLGIPMGPRKKIILALDSRA
ncbi:hypothetical protein ACHQM5_013938 [Ranunculus cassubicifolius]